MGAYEGPGKLMAACLLAFGAMALAVWVGVARGAEELGREARLKVRGSERGSHAIPRFMTGKFAEHLGSNIYNGMSAQIVRNPTFADYPFWTGGMSPDGRTMFHSEDQRIADAIRQQSGRLGFREEQIARLIESRKDGLAMWWWRAGSRSAVKPSPDTGPHGGRAQRVEVEGAEQGIGQMMYLPLHRVRRYEYTMVVRSPDMEVLKVSLKGNGSKVEAISEAKGITGRWQTIRGTLEIAAGEPADGLYELGIRSVKAGGFVIERFVLYPSDHIAGADPDVVRMLKESRLPILRWPGGNFVSGYHWEDGVGPQESRPTRPNWAWGGVEPNLFGTDEFIAFCRAVGCEPMICVNGGDGTPEEAARWVEYCNGPVTSPMGAKRAANGHAEPYNVRYWEAGNELWGSWQVHWTTPRGNADRYRAFHEAMLGADRSIVLYACGAPVLWGREWNAALIKGTADIMRRTTDHPLIGGDLSPATEPLEVYRSFMGVPEVLERKWGELRKSMEDGGIVDPRLGVTELQLFAHIGGRKEGDPPARLTGRNLVNPGTQAEAMYDTLLYHACTRLAPFVEMVTQSATVNHGGGLRKERERVYANPVHYAQTMFAAFADAIPVAVRLDSPEERVAMVLPDVKGTAGEVRYGTIAAMAAVGKDGSLLISIVHRGTGEAVRLSVEVDGFKCGDTAEVTTLWGEVPWAGNTLERHEAVRPVEGTVKVADGKVAIDIRPYAVVRVRIPVAK